MDFERRYAFVSRALASNLIKWARDREPELKKAISSNYTELCQIYREEQIENHKLLEEQERKKKDHDKGN